MAKSKYRPWAKGDLLRYLRKSAEKERWLYEVAVVPGRDGQDWEMASPSDEVRPAFGTRGILMCPNKGIIFIPVLGKTIKTGTWDKYRWRRVEVDDDA
jgi:hypothetical protein